MNDITQYMTADHRRCDELFAAAEGAISAGRWDEAAALHAGFSEALLAHLRMEEEVLFPRFEAASGVTLGPTLVMRREHVQMRALLERLGADIARKARDAALGSAETFLILMQQHNLKEEQILYPMTDRQLQPEAAGVLGEMQALA